jgi:hypothetical protein
MGPSQLVDWRSANLAGWPTPTSLAPAKNGNNEAGNSAGLVAIRELALGMLDTPARLTASGVMLIGSSAGMESGGPLNPEHSRWLMGYPIAWGYCGAMVTRSTRKSRPPSLKRRSKNTTLIELVINDLMAA